MKNKKETLLILTILITICIIIFNRDKLYEAKYIEPKDTLLAITINGEISTTFPTTDMYTGTVECTTGTGKVEWNGTKWVLTTSGITKGSTKCNAKFQKKRTFSETILANNSVEEPYSQPGVEASLSDEAILAYTEDDYGTSYYFRGAVKKNYVQFANKCWRIVRIVGNNSVKLILHNNNSSNSTNPCSSSNNSDTAAATLYSSYSETYNDNAFIGFMYGTPESSNYASTHANINKSTILKNLEVWYTSNLASYADKLADVIWCNDKSTVTNTSFNPSDIGAIGANYGVAKNINYYSPTGRFLKSDGSAGGTGPSLICPNDNNGGKLSKFTVSDTVYGNGNLTYKIGLLTADEALFAGYSSDSNNNNDMVYLQENSAITWITLSPLGFNGTLGGVWAVDGSSGYLGNAGLDNERTFRPSIALISSTMVTGSGTSDDPYVVE